MTEKIKEAIQNAEKIIEHQKNIIETYLELRNSLCGATKEEIKSVLDLLSTETAILQGMELIYNKIKGGCENE